jgi:cytochrome b pre-mRNA-processing protein 3
VTVQARQPAFYAALGAPDTVEGRFELYNLHVVLLLHRLKGLGGLAGETSQVLFDTYVSSLDDALREMGVGDLSVGKKMRKLGEAIYGRVKSYDEAFTDLSDERVLKAVVARTIYADEADERAAPLADYVRRSLAALTAQPLETLLEGAPAWPSIVA